MENEKEIERENGGGEGVVRSTSNQVVKGRPWTDRSSVDKRASQRGVGSGGQADGFTCVLQ